jgi:NAD(P)H dehydrogenase (quinone)
MPNKIHEPRTAEQQDVCRVLGQRLAEWVAVFIHGKKELHPLNNKDRKGPG